MVGYLTIQQTSEKWSLSIRRSNTLCNGGRIEGAIKFGNVWAIPEDERIKSGKYVKNK